MSPNKMERFTQRARKALADAEREARLLRQRVISPHHLFLALLLVEKEDVTYRALHSLGLDYTMVRPTMYIRTMDKPSFMGEPVEGLLELSEQVKNAIERSVVEARLLGDPYIGPEHILIGLMRQPDEVITRVLHLHNVTSARVVKCVEDLLKDEDQPPAQIKQGVIPFAEGMYILEMLNQGKISVVEAKELLETVRVIHDTKSDTEQQTEEWTYILRHTLKLRVSDSTTNAVKTEITMPMRKVVLDLPWFFHRISQGFVGKFSDWTVGDDFIELFIE